MDLESSRQEPRDAGDGWTRSRIVFLAVSGGLTLGFLFFVREVLLPFALALVLAYVLTPAVAWVESRKVPRSASILIVYAVTIGGFYLGVAAVAPRLYTEAVKLSRDAPTIAHDLAAEWGPWVEQRVRALLDRSEPESPPPVVDQPALQIHKQPDGSFGVELGSGVEIVQRGPNHWLVRAAEDRSREEFSVARLVSLGVDETVGYIKRNALELLRIGQLIVSGLTRGIFLTFMCLMVAGYLMHTRDSVMAFFRSLPPFHTRESFDRLLYRIDRGLSGVVRGQLLICAVNGVLSAIGFWLFGLKYWPLLALVAAIMSIIPIFGSILSSIPAVMVGLTQNFWTALWVLLWIVGIHQAEANFFNPKIIGIAAKLHPVLVVLSLLVGEHYFGLWGALLGVPVLSIVQSLFTHFRFESMPDAPPDSVIHHLRPRR